MNLRETLAQLEALGNEKMRAQNAKRGAGDNPFGVKLGDLRGVAAIGSQGARARSNAVA